jgi:1-acyl-sn-glycerol-3-phosphate acyltransferase
MKGKKKLGPAGTRRPSQIFNYILKLFLMPVFWLLYNFHIDRTGIKGIKPPYLVIANHDMNLDPFMASSGFHRPVYIVTSEHLYRIPGLRVLLRHLVGGIPKTKAKADSRTVRGMLEARRLGYGVLVFPETGGRNWGGQTSPVIPSTAKLVRLMKTPVVSVVFEGAYLATPRWAFKRRRGKVTARYHVALTAAEASALSEREVLARLQASIDHDDNLWQKANLDAGRGIVFHARNRAEGIERALYACPSCGTLRALHSEGDSFRCRQCGFGATVDTYGLLDGTSKMREYCSAVEGILAGRASEYLALPETGVPFLSEPMRIWASQRMEPMKEVAHGELRLTRDALEFDSTSGPVRLSIVGITGVTCLHAHILEFVWETRVYRVIFDDRKASIRLWQDAVKFFADRALGGDSGVVEE